MKEIKITEERITKEQYIEFLHRTDLGSQYPKERFEQRIGTLVERVPISIVAKEEDKIVGVCFGITDFAYRLFVTDLGIDRDYVKQGLGSKLLKMVHEIAGGEKNIIMYTCANEDAVSFYKKNGMKFSNDVMQRSEHMEWTEFTVMIKL